MDERKSDTSEMDRSRAKSRASIDALNGMKVVEVAVSGAADIATIAACFAGLLASQYGAEVTRVELTTEATTHGGMSRNGSGSALYDFLNRSKTIVTEMPQAGDATLVTAMPTTVDRWPSQASVLIRPERLDVGTRHSELTVQATSGLLDVLKGHNGGFVALPGNQMAYAAGMAAFNALVATQLVRYSGKPLQRSTVNIVDVACWINWKRRLSTREEGQQPQEWITIRCADGYITLVYQDKHIPLLGELTGNEFFFQASLKRRAERRLRLAQFRKEIQNWAERRTRAEIVAAARRLRVPIGPVLSLEELANDEQLKFRDFLVSDGCRTYPRLPLVARRAERP